LLLRRRTTKDVFRIPGKAEDVVKLITASLKAEIKFRRGQYKASPEQQTYIRQIAEWLTTEDRQFGLLICGKCGNGKTTLMRAVCRAINLLNLKDTYGEDWTVQSISAKQLARMSKQRDLYDKYKAIFRAKMVAVDDVGFEPCEVLDFGNVVNPVIDLMEQRYDEQLFTMLTTNLTPEQIKERYGERISDRFNEMMRKIVFTNASFR
jgi:DNA replication protein DnaC